MKQIIVQAGRRDGSYSSLQEFRREVLDRHISMPYRAMEIGPYIHPTFKPNEADVVTVDIYDTETLRAQAIRDGYSADAVQNVDVITLEGGWSSAGDDFQVIAACHVLEHVPGFFRSLITLRGLLTEGGILFVVLPDKRFSFDRFRPDTPLAQLLYEYYYPEVDLRPLFAIESELLYDRTWRGDQDDTLLNSIEGKDFAAAGKKWHPGMHSYVFQFESLAHRILPAVATLGIVDLTPLEVCLSRQLGEIALVFEASQPGESLAYEHALFSASPDTFVVA